MSFPEHTQYIECSSIVKHDKKFNNNIYSILDYDIDDECSYSDDISLNSIHDNIHENKICNNDEKEWLNR